MTADDNKEIHFLIKKRPALLGGVAAGRREEPEKGIAHAFVSLRASADLAVTKEVFCSILTVSIAKSAAQWKLVRIF